MSDFSWPDALDAIARGEELPAETAEAAMRSMLGGEATPAQTGAFLLGLRTKGETTSEIAACLRAVQDLSIPVVADGAMDMCGTGGDRAGTVNISTMASLVVAGAGVTVAKHGNRAVSSACGSADVLEALGVAVELSPEGVSACVEAAGIGFIFAPSFHPGMRNVMPIRRELGVRTIFNLVMPLANPARVRRQTVGVSDPAVAPRMAAVLAHAQLRAMVFHGGDGLDELTTTTSSTVWDVDGAVRESTFDPATVGIPRATLVDLAGGTAADNARVAEAVLDGAEGPVFDAVVLNAGAGLVVAGVCDDFSGGVERARESIASGKAATALERLRDTSQRVRPA